MHDYIELRVTADPCTEDITDLLADSLAEIGFESFVADETGLSAYIRSDSYDIEAVENALRAFPFSTKLTYESKLIEGKNWNEEWEKNFFQPIIIENQCVVHSSFHEGYEKAEYDIVIDPKMAFGTGHHATTCNMIRFILEEDVEGKKVIDMGTGTGILAILAKMKGAIHVDAIEIDEFALSNAEENVKLNSAEVNLILGNAKKLNNLSKADLFLANINRNIILEDMAEYANVIKKGGTMILSGFYQQDVPVIEQKAMDLGFSLTNVKEQDKWVALRFVKN